MLMLMQMLPVSKSRVFWDGKGHLWENRIEIESHAMSLRHQMVGELSLSTLPHTGHQLRGGKGSFHKFSSGHTETDTQREDPEVQGGLGGRHTVYLLELSSPSRIHWPTL